MSIELHFDEERRADIERAWTEWWAGELNRPIVQITDPARVAFTPHQFTSEFISEIPIDQALDYYQSQLESTHYYADALPVFHNPLYFGMSGDRVRPMPEQLTVWSEADQPIPFEDLHPSYDPGSVRSRAMALRARAVERWDDRVTIAHTGLGVGLQSLSSLRTTQQLLFDLYENPDEVLQVSNELTDVSISRYRACYDIIKKSNRGTTNWAPLWSPERTHLHECDFSCMISPEMFERFVIPDLAKCIQETNHAFYHLDGEDAITHLDALLSLGGLLGIQWVPESGKPQGSEWMWLFKRIKDRGKLCQLYIDPGGALDVVRELGGRGFCFIIVQYPQMPPEEIDDFMSVLAAEDRHAV